MYFLHHLTFLDLEWHRTELEPVEITQKGSAQGQVRFRQLTCRHHGSALRRFGQHGVFFTISPCSDPEGHPIVFG